MTHSPTDEQASILDAGSHSSSNLCIRALAGTGKTTTLEMLERSCGIRPVLYLVFNKKNAEEASARMLSTTTVRTLNSQGNRIWSQTQSARPRVDPKKTQSILSETIKELPRHAQREASDAYWQIVQAVTLAKALGYVPDGSFLQARRLIDRNSFHLALEERPDPFVSELIDTILVISIKAAYNGTIDYPDQLYMPALFGGTFPNYPLVMVDELQDLSPVDHALLDKLARNRIFGVGDPWQSIYAFRGAKQAGMEDAQARFAMNPLDLSVSFRCPSAIVEAARWRVPHFKWIKEGGHVETLQELDPQSIPDGATFICRNNAPLLRAGFQLLRQGRGVQIAGSEVGPKVVGIMRKLADPDTKQPAVLDAIEMWRAERLAKQSKTAGDIADCMQVFAGFGATLGQAVAYAEHLFKQKGKIQLMTIHKAKGLEFDTVYFLDRWLCQDDEQDLNVQYVGITRAKEKLFFVDSERIKW